MIFVSFKQQNSIEIEKNQVKNLGSIKEKRLLRKKSEVLLL
jgi:hypothetical protein